MPLGVTSLSWDSAAQGMRIDWSNNRPDSIFNLQDIPGNIQNQGLAAVESWLNTNLGSKVFGAGSPPPYILVKVRTMSPFYFDFVVSDSPISANYPFTPPTPPPIP